MAKKFILFFSVLVLITIGSLLFIKSSNDHKECSTEIEHSKDSNGNNISTEKHICKEKYNF